VPVTYNKFTLGEGREQMLRCRNVSKKGYWKIQKGSYGPCEKGRIKKGKHPNKKDHFQGWRRGVKTPVVGRFKLGPVRTYS